jgi:hypothetical protein
MKFIVNENGYDKFIQYDDKDECFSQWWDTHTHNPKTSI